MRDDILSTDSGIVNLHPTEGTRCQMEDYVSIPGKRIIDSKSSTTNGMENFSELKKMIPPQPITYTIEDKDGEQIKKRYEQELLKSVSDFDSKN